MPKHYMKKAPKKMKNKKGKKNNGRGNYINIS